MTAPESSLPPPPPTQVGRYELLHKLATGGMAEVFLARAVGPGGFAKTLVIKRVLPHLAENPEFIQMFFSEAKIAAQLNHPNIVQIFDFGEEDHVPYIAMEYVDGPNLRVLLRRAKAESTPLPLGVCARIVAGACEGLAHAHALVNAQTGAPVGLIHRDVSADNILLSRIGAVKITDFGIAKAATTSAHHTQTGTFKGKLGYVAPEQLEGVALDLRVDVFSLGVVLYELITGRRPFQRSPGQTEAETLRALLYTTQPPAAALRSDVPDALEQILARALAKDPSARYQNCLELRSDLEQYLRSLDVTTGPPEIARVISALGAVPRTPAGSSFPPASLLPELIKPSARVAALADRPPPPPSVSIRADFQKQRRLFGAGMVVLLGAGLVIGLLRTDRPPRPAPKAPVPRPAYASLEIQTVPPAQVRIDGELFGPSPIRAPALRPGIVEVEVFDPQLGFSKHERFQLVSGENGLRTIVVQQTMAEFRIRPYASVFVDGKPLGETPFPAIRLYEGKHAVKLVNRELGKELKEEWTIRPGELNVFKKNLAE